MQLSFVTSKVVVKFASDGVVITGRLSLTFPNSLYAISMQVLCYSIQSMCYLCSTVTYVAAVKFYVILIYKNVIIFDITVYVIINSIIYTVRENIMSNH